MPLPLYFMTHAYFCFYHALANVVLRRVRRATAGARPAVAASAMAVAVFLLAYVTAFMETATIAHFPYYTFKVVARSVHACLLVLPHPGETRCLQGRERCQFLHRHSVPMLVRVLS